MKKLFFLCAPILLAHDLYMVPEHFTPASGSELRVVLHNGDEFPEAKAPVKPERLRDTKLRSKSGMVEFRKITAEATRTTALVQIPGKGTAILTARTIPNFIELDPEKFKMYLEHENLSSVLAWRKTHGEESKPGRERYSKYVKSIVRAGAADAYYRERTGLTIEIIPGTDPYTLKVGATLPVQLLFRGAPAPDIALESMWLEDGQPKTEWTRTDREGRARIPVKASGLHKLHAIVMERCREPQVADWESFWASLTFEVAPTRSAAALLP